MAAMLPLAAKYGTGLVVLALDGGGISDDPHCRRDTALRVAQAAQAAGVPQNAIFIDCLAMAASVSQDVVLATPEAIRLVRQAGYRTILGVFQRQPRPAGPGRAQPGLPGGLSGGGAQRAHRQPPPPGGSWRP